MGKLRRFLGLFVCFVALIFASNSFGAGYTCPDLKKYISCNTNKHLTSTEVGNSCVDCPDNSESNGTTTYCTCKTGYANPDGIEQGQVVNGQECTAVETEPLSCTTLQHMNSDGTECLSCPYNSTSEGGTAKYCNCNEGYSNPDNVEQGQVVNGDTCTIKSAPSSIYTLTLEANGGAIDISDFDNCSATDTGAQCSCTNGVCNLPATSAMTRDGYSALGWAKSNSATSAEYTTKITISANTTLYAVWEANCIPITIDANDGDMGDTPATIYKIDDPNTNIFYSDSSCKIQITKLSAVPTRTGYELQGLFNIKTGFGNKYFDSEGNFVAGTGTSYYLDGQTLYAHWLACDYTVEFNANGGSGTMVDVTWTYGAAHNYPANEFTRDGYTFTGWSTKSTGTAEYPTVGWGTIEDLSTTCDDTVTLYAIWEENEDDKITITFSCGEGRELQTLPESFKVDFGEEFTIDQDPADYCKRDGYHLRTQDEDYGTNAYTWTLTTNTGISRTLTVSNNSESYNSLSYPGLTSVTVTPDYVPNTIYIRYSVNNQDRFVSTWHLGEDPEFGELFPMCNYGDTFTFADLSNDAYESYGPWVRNENGKEYQQKQTIDCTYEELGVYGGFMTKFNYDGMHSKWIMNDGTLIDSADGNYADIYEATFNATAVPKKFNITYELNGGTNHSENPNTYDVETVVKFKTPTRANSDFEGWYKESTFATSIANTSAVMGDLTLYAKWSCKDGYNANDDNTACISNAVKVKYAASDTKHWNNWVAPSSPTECPVGGACTIPEPVSQTASGYGFKEWRCTLTNGADCGTFQPGDTLTASADWVAASQEITLTAYTRSTTYVVQVYGGAGTYKAFNCTYDVDCNLDSLVSQVGADSSKLIGLVCQNTVNQIPDVCEAGMSIPLGTVWNLSHSVKGDNDTIKLNLNVGLVYQCSRGQYLVAPSSTSAMSCAVCPKNSYCGGQDGNGTDTDANYQFAYMDSDKYKTSCATATNNEYSYTEGTGSYSVNQCYRNCTSDDVPTGQKLTGGILFADASGTCEYECVDGYYCPPDAAPVECPEDDKGRTVRSPATATSAADCYVECEDLDGVSADKKIINYENGSYPACEYSGIDCPDGQHLNDAKDGCVANTFTVQFDNGDGATGTMNSVLVTYNDGTVAPEHGFTVPQPAGSQEFVQWSCASKYGSCGTVMPDDNISTITKVHDDVITLTAIWEAVTFTITYDKNASDATAGKPATAQVKYGDMYPELDLRPTRAGYSFGGYDPSPSCSTGLAGTYLANGQPNAQFLETKDITLYACWIECAPGSFCGPDTPDEQRCPPDDEGRDVSSDEGATQSSDCFVECFGGTVDNGSYSPVAGKIHYANEKYASCEYDVSCKGGYHANGLACDANVFNVKYSAGSGTGTGPASPLQCTYGQNCPAPSNTYTYPGFVFTNWACTLDDGSSCGNVEAGDDISTKTQVENATITLTAQWQAMGDGVCYAGMYFDGSAMVTCSQGSFCDGSGTYPNCHIETCDSGYNTDGTGAKGESSCKKQSVASCVLPASCPDGVAKCEFDTDDTYECTMVQGTAGCTPNAGVDTACPLIVPENPDPTDPEITCSAGYYFDPSDKESPCKKCSELGGGFTLSANGNFTGPGVCYKVCSEDCPECPPNQVCNSGNWGNTLSGKQYYNTTSCVLDNGEQCGNGSGDVACEPGFYPVDGVCVECEEGDYCDGNESEPCPSSHPNSEKGNSDVNMCYADCTTNDVTNSTSVSGIKYYGGDNTCQATMCKAGFYLENGKCVSCPENEVCDGETRKTCSELTDGEFPLGTANNGDKNKCYRECSASDLPDANPDAITGNVYADGTKTCSASGCQPGYYPGGNGGCTDCEPGDYCDGNESVQCPPDYPKSDANAESVNDCYADCTTTDIANSATVSGVKYYNQPKQCKLGRCQSGYKPVNNTCEKCGEGEICDGGEDTTCQPGYYPDGNGGCVECEPGNVCDGKGKTECPSSHPNSAAKNSDKNKCYTNCTSADIPNAGTVSGIKYYDGTNTCSASGCQSGYYPQGGECLPCEPGNVCDGKGKVSCPSSHPNSDAQNSDKNKCYTSCKTSAVANSVTVSGRDYFGIADTCQATKCEAGYYLQGGKCVSCPEGEVCDGKTRKTCSELTNGKYTLSDGMASSADDCYAVCTTNDIAHSSSVSGRKTLKNPNACVLNKCVPGYQKLGNVCEQCSEGNWCPGDETENSCPDSHPLSNAGASAESQCFKECESYMEYGCTAIPKNETEYHPNECSYRYESETGNPSIIKNGKCVETACKPNYEMINGKCQLCNRENALTYLPEGNCRIETCMSGYHPNGERCDSDVAECRAPKATVALQSWDYTLKAYGVCVIYACEDGYHIASNACVADVQECSVENGVGVKEWNWATGGWGECEATHCNPGFTNDPALTNERTKQCGHCKNKFSVKGEIAVSSYVEECEIASCLYQGEMYNLDNNECHPICDVNGYEDETGYMKWNPSRRKCERTCKEGYSMW